jgi:hypothetical protein
MQSGSSKPVLGWREWVSFPEWGIHRVRAKVDTGARTSAIHCSHIEHVGEDRVRFRVVLSRKNPGRFVEVEAPLSRRTVVKPSSGDRHERVVVEALVRVGAVEKLIEVTLAEREGMLLRMLLGRRAISPEFVVDASLRYVQGKPDRASVRRGKGKSG